MSCLNTRDVFLCHRFHESAFLTMQCFCRELESPHSLQNVSLCLVYVQNKNSTAMEIKEYHGLYSKNFKFLIYKYSNSNLFTKVGSHNEREGYKMPTTVERIDKHQSTRGENEAGTKVDCCPASIVFIKKNNNKKIYIYTKIPPCLVCFSYLPAQYVAHTYLPSMLLILTCPVCCSYLPAQYVTHTYLPSMLLILTCPVCCSYLPAQYVAHTYLPSMLLILTCPVCCSYLPAQYVNHT